MRELEMDRFTPPPPRLELTLIFSREEFRNYSSVHVKSFIIPWLLPFIYYSLGSVTANAEEIWKLLARAVTKRKY